MENVCKVWNWLTNCIAYNCVNPSVEFISGSVAFVSLAQLTFFMKSLFCIFLVKNNNPHLKFWNAQNPCNSYLKDVRPKTKTFFLVIRPTLHFTPDLKNKASTAKIWKRHLMQVYPNMFFHAVAGNKHFKS